MSHFNQTIDELTRLAVIKGKQIGCRKVYDDFSTPVYNLALKILQNRDDAFDVMQNSFITAFQKTAQWSGQVAFGFWLRKIVINQCFDLIKKNQQLLSADFTYTNQEIDQINYEQQHDANLLLSQLPPLSRSILWLYEVEGLTHQEIADSFQMSISFSKSQLSRSKQLLRQWLQNQEENHEQLHEQQNQ